MTKKRRIIAYGAGGLVGLCLTAAALVFLVLPPIVDGRMNRVPAHDPWPVSTRAQALHDTLDVADLHCDALLWNRNLLARNSRGHVDLPRLAEGNVALQVFTAVTKTPKHKNYDATSSDTDDITGLAIAQRWPVRTWFSVFQRAKYQASKLDDFAAQSNGRLTVARTSEDLKEFIARRHENPGSVAALLGIEGAHCLEQDLANVQALFDAGYRTLGLAPSSTMKWADRLTV